MLSLIFKFILFILALSFIIGILGFSISLASGVCLLILSLIFKFIVFGFKLLIPILIILLLAAIIF